MLNTMSSLREEAWQCISQMVYSEEYIPGKVLLEETPKEAPAIKVGKTWGAQEPVSAWQCKPFLKGVSWLGSVLRNTPQPQAVDCTGLVNKT